MVRTRLAAVLLRLVAGWWVASGGLGADSPAALLSDEAVPGPLPLELWANPRPSGLRPRAADKHPAPLLAKMGHDFDPAWMAPSRPSHQDSSAPPTTGRWRTWLQAEATAAGQASSMGEALTSWLMDHASCTTTYTWRDLGPEFWPRWVRWAVCGTGPKSCSWPPGMSCRHGPPRHLNILRWHCRLRNKKKRRKKKRKKMENNIWLSLAKEERRKRRKKKYRCLWVKVPYPVPEECVCACPDNMD